MKDRRVFSFTPCPSRGCNVAERWTPGKVQGLREHGLWQVDTAQNMLGMGIEPFQFLMGSCGRYSINSMPV